MPDSAQTREILTLRAPADKLYSVVADFESYPKWLPEFSQVRVLERRSPTDWIVQFSFRILLKTVVYKLAVTLDPQARTVRWTLAESDWMSRNDGGWLFEPVDAGSTRVTYDVALGVKVPLGGSIADKVSKMLTGGTLPRTMQALEKRARALA